MPFLEVWGRARRRQNMIIWLMPPKLFCCLDPVSVFLWWCRWLITWNLDSSSPVTCCLVLISAMLIWFNFRWVCHLPIYKEQTRTCGKALVGGLSGLEHRPVHHKVTGSILGQGTFLGWGFDPRLGCMSKATD